MRLGRLRRNLSTVLLAERMAVSHDDELGRKLQDLNLPGQRTPRATRTPKAKAPAEVVNGDGQA